MLAGTRVVTVLPVTDVARARGFYEGRLGLGPGRMTPAGEVLYESGGSTLELSPRAQPTRAEHTVASFEVPDVPREVQDLEKRGVRFEDYDLPGLRTVDHVAQRAGARAAWFKDTEGNILCIHDLH
jgi:catechol 2,3-dioxygenase-like lactoylglutathione lyase family enzyme